jgi:hypothetical protein
MERVVTVAEIVRREVAAYNTPAWKSKSYFLEDGQNQVYGVVDVPESDHPNAPQPIFIVLARVVDDTIIIHQDITDRPLYEELVHAGIPREKIVLAYAQPPRKDAE